MDLRIDDRGKYFTARVSKESIAVALRTTEHLIVGQIHVRPDQRLKDEMNLSQERFVAVTDAHVYDSQGQNQLFESAFLIVASQHIIFITPLDALKEDQQLGWLGDVQEDTP